MLGVWGDWGPSSLPDGECPQDALWPARRAVRDAGDPVAAAWAAVAELDEMFRGWPADRGSCALV
jgi:hypothetical protein